MLTLELVASNEYKWLLVGLDISEQSRMSCIRGWAGVSGWVILLYVSMCIYVCMRVVVVVVVVVGP